MNLSDFQHLRTSEGQDLLAGLTALAPQEANFLRLHQQFAKKHPSNLVKAALETVFLRQKAKGKFSRSDQMYFTREGLEQSSGEWVAAYRAKRFPQDAIVADLCCGIGGDLIGLAANHRVYGVDLDELRLAMALENATVYGHAERVNLIQADASQFWHNDVTAIFVDPDRRADGTRHVAMNHYQPNVQQLLHHYGLHFPFAIKIAPGIAHQELDALDCEAEFISVGGELKECVLWFGPLRTTRRRATILPAGLTMAADEPAPLRAVSRPLQYIYDPDPAILRAGLVSNLAVAIDAQPIDLTIAYLTSKHQHMSAWVTTYEVEEVLPFHAKQIGNALKSRGIGHVSITKRGSPVDVDQLRKSWKLTGHLQRTVILTRHAEQPIAIIAKRL